MATEEQERKRIARELHDGLGALLSAARINHTLLGKVLPHAGTAIAYKNSHHILNQMQQEIETVTNNLIPDYITLNSLENALAILVTKFDRPGTFDIRLQTYGVIQDMNPERSFSLYRIIEEIIHNALKHSGGSKLMMQLMYHEDQLHITLEDNGIGFKKEKTYTGMGLSNISSRVKTLNGYMNLSSIENKGTCYILEIPYAVNETNKE